MENPRRTLSIEQNKYMSRIKHIVIFSISNINYMIFMPYEYNRKCKIIIMIEICFVLM